MLNKLNVFYHGRLVGTLVKQGDYYFQYDEKWISNGFSISPLSLPLQSKVFIPSKDCIDGIFGVYLDSLPDSWGRLLLSRYIKKNFPNQKIDIIYMLTCVGNNGMGALEYEPCESISYYKFEIDYDEIQKESELALNNEEYDVDKLYLLGGSSGGARPKALVLIDGEKWIVKFQSRYDIKDAGFVEYQYAIACREIGINIPDFKLINSKLGKGFFAIKRFDRKKEERIHMISVAGLLEADYRSPCLDYNDLFKLTKMLTKNNRNDVEELYKRMCFNVLAHNLDDHIKNFSFIYDEESKNYKLSPAYDMTYSNTYYNEHTTSVNGKGKNIEYNDLLEVGLKAGIEEGKCLELYTKVKDVVEIRLNKYIK